MTFYRVHQNRQKNKFLHRKHRGIIKNKERNITLKGFIIDPFRQCIIKKMELSPFLCYDVRNIIGIYAALSQYLTFCREGSNNHEKNDFLSNSLDFAPAPLFMFPRAKNKRR